MIHAGVRTDSTIGVDKFRIRKLKIFMLYHFYPTIQFLSMANTFSCLNIHCVFIGLDSSNLQDFAWQQGYGAFSVGVSQIQETVHYIEQQLEHHRTRTFQEEYLAFIKKQGAHFGEKYLWD